MSTSSETTSRSQIERQISRRLRRVIPSSELTQYEVEVLVQLGYEQEAMQRLESRKSLSEYDSYTYQRLSLSPRSRYSHAQDDRLIETLRSYRDGTANYHTLLDCADPKCTPSLIAQMLSTIAIDGRSHPIASDVVHQIRTLSENVRLKKVHSATCEALVALAILEFQNGSFEIAVRSLMDARAHALHSPTWIALANAALYQAIAFISKDHHEHITQRWAAFAGIVSDNMPRLRGLLSPPSFEYKPLSDLQSVTAFREKAASFLHAYAHDALLSADELSVSTYSAEIRKIASDMSVKRVAMLTLIEDLDNSLTQLAQERIRISAIATERRALLALASHEIKNPLLSIALLASRTVDADDRDLQEKYRLEILRQIDVLETEIQAYLMDSDQRRAELFHNNSSCNIVAVLEEEIRTIEIQLKEKQQSVIIDAPANVATMISETAARVLIRNVLSNASRHANTSSSINITIGQHAHGVLLTIVNHIAPNSSHKDPYSSGRGRALVESVLDSIGASWTTEISADKYSVTIIIPAVAIGTNSEE